MQNIGSEREERGTKGDVYVSYDAEHSMAMPLEGRLFDAASDLYIFFECVLISIMLSPQKSVMPILKIAAFCELLPHYLSFIHIQRAARCL